MFLHCLPKGTNAHTLWAPTWPAWGLRRLLAARRAGLRGAANRGLDLLEAADDGVQLGGFERWSWWVVLTPFGLAVAWWAWADWHF